MQEKNVNTALLVMDMQAGILSGLSDSTAVVANVARAIAAARSKQLPVIYVVLNFRPGFPEINMNNKAFSTSKKVFAELDMQAFSTIAPALTPAAGDVIVTKKRFSAFAGSDLDIVLRSLGIQQLVLTGISTAGVVLSTMREAADKDYGITILEDGCTDRDEEVHRVLITKIFPRSADVISVDEWIRLK